MTPGRSSAIRATDRRAPAGGWHTATVIEVSRPTTHGVALRLDVADRVDHWPGQHYVLRLTAEDGYVAQRSYSVASDPGDPLVELYVERLPDGEVSSYLADVVEPGDTLEVRGPIGGWFAWSGDSPAVGLGGGSGVVPLVAMLRHATRLGRPGDLRLAVSARTRRQLPYADELLAAGATVALSREFLGERAAGRLTVAELAPLVEGAQTCFVCGSAGFADAASALLVDAGVEVARIRVERFGPG